MSSPDCKRICNERLPMYSPSTTRKTAVRTGCFSKRRETALSHSKNERSGCRAFLNTSGESGRHTFQNEKGLKLRHLFPPMCGDKNALWNSESQNSVAGEDLFSLPLPVVAWRTEIEPRNFRHANQTRRRSRTVLRSRPKVARDNADWLTEFIASPRSRGSESSSASASSPTA